MSKEYAVQKALGTLNLYSIKVPELLSPDNGQIYYFYIDAFNKEDARERICGIRGELGLFKETLVINKCHKKESGEIVWDD